MCSAVNGDGDPVVTTTSYEEWSATDDNEEHIRTMATADLMEFYANEIVEELAHRPYIELGIHSDSDSELAAAYSGLETIMEETSDDMRSDTDSMRSGPTSWAWSQDSADVETVIDAGRGRDSRFEDDFNPLDGVEAAMAASGKLTNGIARSGRSSDKYGQLFDFEAFLKHDASGAGGVSEPPSMDPMFVTSATQFPFSDCEQAAPHAVPLPLPPGGTDGTGFRLGPLDGCCQWSPFTSLPERGDDGPRELAFSLDDVLGHRTRPAPDSEPGNGRPAAPVTSAEVLGATCNGSSGVTAAAPPAARAALSGGRSVAAHRGGEGGSGVPKWDLGSCEDFENLNRRIESLTFDFEEEERRSLEFIVDGNGDGDGDGDAGSSEESGESGESSESGGAASACSARRQRDWRVRRFHSFGDLSMITEDELQEGGGQRRLEARDATERPARRRPAGHPGLLRHSSENLSEDSGYGDHTGDRVSPPNPRSTSLLPSSAPAGTGVSNLSPRHSAIRRLTKSTSDLSPGSQRRRRLLELISRDEQRRARLYSDSRDAALSPDARLSPPRLSDAPPPVDSDGGEETERGDDRDARDAGEGTDERDEIESVLVLLENEESNSVIQVLREKVARARALDSMASAAAAAAPVPAPRTAVQRAPAVYQNVPTGARGRRTAASSAAPTRRSSETETPPPDRDRRVKRDIEQFERIKEAFLEKGTYNVHADIAPAPTRADSGSTPELSDRRRGDNARTGDPRDPRPADSARPAAHAAVGETTVHAAVNKGSPETQHDPGGIQGHRTSDNTTRAEPERTAEQPRDIYLSESEAQLVRMSRSAFGRPKPLDLKLAEEFLLLEGIEGEGEGEVYPVDAEEYPRERESPCGGGEWGPAACVPPLREEVAARDGQPISGSGETGPPGWTEGGVPGPGRSRSLWNLAAAVDAAPPPQPECADGTCDWQRSRNRHGAWLLSKSVQDLWSENNMDSPRRLDYYNQTMEWPGSGDYLAACSAERLRGGALSPASSSGLPTDAYCETLPAHPHRTPLNLDGGAGAATCGAAALKLGRPPSDVCSSWLAASMEPDTSEHRSLNGQAYLVEPQAARPAGTAPLTDGSDARTMRAHNSFTARVPVRAYGAGSDVEVYINREQPPAETERAPEQTGQARVRRGVQFSPVVSEVQWRESYLESEPDTRQDTRQDTRADSRTNGQQHQQQQQQHQQQQQQQQQRLPQSADTNGASHQTTQVQSGAERAAQRHRSPPPAPPPRQTPQRAAPEPPQRASEPAEPPQRDGLPTTEAGAAAGAAAGLRAVRPPTVPVVAPRSSASLPSPAPAVGAGAQTEGPVKSNTIGPIRGRSNGGQASPVTVRTQQIRPEKTEKPEKPPKTSVLQRLGLGRLSGRSKPKPPPKPENMRPTRSPPPPPASPPPPTVSSSQPPAVSPVIVGQAEGHRPVTSTPVMGQRPVGSAVPAPVASPVVATERSVSPASPASTVATGQAKGSHSPSVTSSSDQSTIEQSQSSSNQSTAQSAGVGSVDQSATKSDFHVPPSPAVRTKSLSLPRAGAEIQLESGSPAVSGVGAAASPAGASAADTPSGAGRPTAKPPLPPQALRIQTQAARARLTSARRHFFQLEQQRVIPLRSVPAAPIPDAAPSQTGNNGRPSAAAHINDAFERFRRRAQEDRARLAKSTPDLSLIEAATRSIVRPLVPPPPPSSAAAVPSSIDRRAAAAGDSRSVTLQQEGNVVILHADGGAAAARPASKSRDRFAQRRAAALARARSRSVGVLETDLDAPCAPHQETDLDAIVLSLQQCIDEATPPREKAKSLLHLDRGGMEFSLPRAAAADSRAKSMEFLLDDDNKTAVQPPENDLMRGDRQLSEHELRFQRSLRNLNTPEWYKKSSVKPEAGLRRDYGSGSLAGGWSGLNSKSTSKESLQSSRCTTPTTQSKVVIPSRVRAPDWRYVRGTSRESLASPGSGAASPSVSERPGSGAQSPVSSLGGVHSRRPVYMGWRSQERLSTSGYQTPVDRLASSFTRNRSEGNLTGTGRLSLPRGSSGASSATGSTSSVSGALRPPPDLDVHTSIREVTSAIVHYFDSAGGPGSGGESGGRGGASPRSPRRRRSPAGARSSRSTSPSKRPVWLETAFVGTKPMDEPPTPEAAGAVLSDPLAAGGGSGGSGATSPTPPPVSESRADPPAADRYEFGELLMV